MHAHAAMYLDICEYPQCMFKCMRKLYRELWDHGEAICLLRGLALHLRSMSMRQGTDLACTRPGPNLQHEKEKNGVIAVRVTRVY